MNTENQKSTTETASSQGGVRGRLAYLYSYADNYNYEIKIPSDTDLDSDDFSWEEILLSPLEDRGEEINTDSGVSWGWV